LTIQENIETRPENGRRSDRLTKKNDTTISSTTFVKDDRRDSIISNQSEAEEMKPLSQLKKSNDEKGVPDPIDNNQNKTVIRHCYLPECSKTVPENEEYFCSDECNVIFVKKAFRAYFPAATTV